MNDATRSLSGTRALVTGGARRLGRAIAEALVEAGAAVTLHYRTSGAEAEETARALRARGAEVDLVQADLADPEQTGRLLDRAWETAGPIDLLVNNASVFPRGRLAELEFDELVRVIAVNAWAPFALLRALAVRLEAEGRSGSVVNLLDTRIAGKDPAHAAYHLSKQVLAHLTRMTAREFAPVLRVNAVAPGFILPPEGEDRSYLEARTRAIPLRRPGEAADVADAVVYLLGAPYVTGDTLFIDGGQKLTSG